MTGSDACWTPLADGGAVLLPRSRNPLGRESEHVHDRRARRAAKERLAALRAQQAAEEKTHGRQEA